MKVPPWIRLGFRIIFDFSNIFLLFLFFPELLLLLKT